MNSLFTKPRTLFILLTLMVAFVFAFAPVKEKHPTNRKDALLIKAYELEAKKYLMETEHERKRTRKQLEKEFEESGYSMHTTITYAPDSSFKIIVVKAESCGSSCHGEWFAWVHFNLHKKETIIRHDFTQRGEQLFCDINNIYLLPNNTYLVFDNIFGSASSVLAHSYDRASIISFDERSIIHHPLTYNGMNAFIGCTDYPREENSGWEPYLKYDTATNDITYAYGQSGYAETFFTDTIREGRFRYRKGEFWLEKESTTILYKRIDDE